MWNYLCAVSVSRGGYLTLANQWLPVVCFDIIYMYIIKEFPSSSCATEENHTAIATDCIASNRPAQYFGGIGNADTGMTISWGWRGSRGLFWTTWLHLSATQSYLRYANHSSVFRCLKVLHQILKCCIAWVFTHNYA